MAYFELANELNDDNTDDIYNKMIDYFPIPEVKTNVKAQIRQRKDEIQKAWINLLAWRLTFSYSKHLYAKLKLNVSNYKRVLFREPIEGTDDCQAFVDLLFQIAIHREIYEINDMNKLIQKILNCDYRKQLMGAVVIHNYALSPVIERFKDLMVSAFNPCGVDVESMFNEQMILINHIAYNMSQEGTHIEFTRMKVNFHLFIGQLKSNFKHLTEKYQNIPELIEDLNNIENERLEQLQAISNEFDIFNNTLIAVDNY